MANPSHSTASPDPRNPDTSLNSQPVTPAKAGVHVDAGLDSGFRRNDGEVNGNDSEVKGNDGGGGDPQNALDRRTLLTGAAAAAAAGAAGAGLATAGMPGLDPVVAVYRRLLKLQADPLNDYCDEDDPAYMRLCYAIDDADDALVLTRATSTDGVRVKFARLAYLHHGGPERAIRDCELAHSIIADFAHLLARRAL